MDSDLSLEFCSIQMSRPWKLQDQLRQEHPHTSWGWFGRAFTKCQDATEDYSHNPTQWKKRHRKHIVEEAFKATAISHITFSGVLRQFHYGNN